MVVWTEVNAWSPSELVESSAPFAIMMIILSNPIFYPISEIVPINRLYNRGFCSNSNTGTPIRTNHPTTISDRKIESFRFLIRTFFDFDSLHDVQKRIIKPKYSYGGFQTWLLRNDSYEKWKFWKIYFFHWIWNRILICEMKVSKLLRVHF